MRAWRRGWGRKYVRGGLYAGDLGDGEFLFVLAAKAGEFPGGDGGDAAADGDRIFLGRRAVCISRAGAARGGLSFGPGHAL